MALWFLYRKSGAPISSWNLSYSKKEKKKEAASPEPLQRQRTPLPFYLLTTPKQPVPLEQLSWYFHFRIRPYHVRLAYRGGSLLNLETNREELPLYSCCRAYRSVLKSSDFFAGCLLRKSVPKRLPGRNNSLTTPNSLDPLRGFGGITKTTQKLLRHCMFHVDRQQTR